MVSFRPILYSNGQFIHSFIHSRVINLSNDKYLNIFFSLFELLHVAYEYLHIPVTIDSIFNIVNV